MARRKGRAPEEFSMSFLDVICCGFGAIILLLMITKTVEPQIIEASTINLEGLVAQLRDQGIMGGGPPPFAQKDRSLFLQKLDEMVNAIRRDHEED